MNASPFLRRLLLPTLLLVSCVHPMFAGNLQLVSTRHSDFAPTSSGDGDSSMPIISANGRYVLFASTAENLVVTSNNAPGSGIAPRFLNVYLRDRTNRTTKLISVSRTGGGGNGDSLPAGISTNGQYVLFESAASNLVLNDTNNVSDIFRRDLVNSTTVLISANNSGVCGNGTSRDPVMTPSGRYVAFVSAATNLVSGDTNGIVDVFLRDVPAGTNKLVSVGARGTNSSPLSGSSEAPVITPDGRYVAFYSTATNLLPSLRRSGEVYVRDLLLNTTIWASSNAWSVYQSTYASSNIFAANQRISDDGRYVAYEAFAPPVVFTPTPSRWSIVFRADLQNGTQDIVNIYGTNAGYSIFEQLHTLDMTPDGRFIAFVAATNAASATNLSHRIYRWDAQTAETQLISRDADGEAPARMYCIWPSLDTSGRYVAYLSDATNLTAEPKTGAYHIYVNDTQTGANQLMDKDANGAGFGVDLFAVPSMSANGDSVAFETGAEDSVTDNRATDVLVRDRSGTVPLLISSRDASLPSTAPNGPSGFTGAVVSGNGRYAAFSSDATDLVPNDANGRRDVFIRDLLLGTNLLVSVNTNGMTGAGYSSEPSVSGDGRYVAFSSRAWDLTPGVGAVTNYQHVYVRDLQAGTTTLASIGSDGINPGNGDSFSPTLSTDGRYLLFRSAARSLAPSMVQAADVLVLRDLQLGTNYALTSNQILSASMTPDASRVAFITSVSGQNTVFVWDNQSQTKIYTNAAGISVNFVQLSPEGQKVTHSRVSAGLSGADLVNGTNWTIAGGLVAAAGHFSHDGRWLTHPLNVAGFTDKASIYLYDTLAGTNLLLGVPGESTENPEISLNGRFIAYRSYASNNVATDSNGVPDIVLYDRFSAATYLISINVSNNWAGNGRCYGPIFSADNKNLLFCSSASDLVNQTPNSHSKIFSLPIGALINTDADNDGMDDQWEIDTFGSTGRDGTGDFDGDGATDLYEYQTGTNPKDANAYLRIAVGAPLPTASWQAVPWKSYHVQYKNDLDEANWHELNGSMPLNGNIRSINDPSPDPVKRFYRVVLDY